jgi:hypothetical protein
VIGHQQVGRNAKLQSTETVLGVLRESLESPVLGNGYAGFGGGPLEKVLLTQQEPRHAAYPAPKAAHRG